LNNTKYLNNKNNKSIIRTAHGQKDKDLNYKKNRSSLTIKSFKTISPWNDKNYEEK